MVSGTKSLTVISTRSSFKSTILRHRLYAEEDIFLSFTQKNDEGVSNKSK